MSLSMAKIDPPAASNPMTTIEMASMRDNITLVFAVPRAYVGTRSLPLAFSLDEAILLRHPRGRSSGR